MKKSIVLCILICMAGIKCTHLWSLKRAFKPVDDTQIRYIRDNQNRITIYHGVNIANHTKMTDTGVPWHSPEDYAKLKEWGFNLVRYLVHWDKLEPTENVIDTNYLNAIKLRWKWMDSIGIDFIVDVHQDLYAKKFSGNGFPQWTINDEGIKFNKRKPWNANYLEPAVITAYKNYWNNKYLKYKYTNAVKIFAENASEFNHAIGIDLMNEPFNGISTNFEPNNLKNLYQKICDTLKNNNINIKIYFEPAMYTASGIPSQLKWKPPQNAVYYPHYYDPMCHEGKPYKRRNLKLLKLAIPIKVNEAIWYNTPLVFGEFGINPNTKGYLKYLTNFTNICNQYNSGWTYYTYDLPKYSEYTFINEDKSPRKSLYVLSHIYPQKIAGKYPLYQNSNNTFTLKYQKDPNISGNTEIYCPPWISVSAVTTNGKISKNENTYYYENGNQISQKITIKYH